MKSHRIGIGVSPVRDRSKLHCLPFANQFATFFCKLHLHLQLGDRGLVVLEFGAPTGSTQAARTRSAPRPAESAPAENLSSSSPIYLTSSRGHRCCERHRRLTDSPR